MHSITKPTTIALLLAALAISACAQSSAFDSGAASDEGPARLEAVNGSPFARIVLSARAANRVGIATAPVRRAPVAAAAAGRAIVPYAAVLYDADGHAFVYASPRPLTFVRSPIAIARIAARGAVVTAGPPAGTPVVTVGAAELLGTEYGVEG